MKRLQRFGHLSSANALDLVWIIPSQPARCQLEGSDGPVLECEFRDGVVAASLKVFVRDCGQFLAALP